MHLVDGTHACDGSYVVGDGHQRGSGQVFLTDAVSLLFAHHVAKTGGNRKHTETLHRHGNPGNKQIGRQTTFRTLIRQLLSASRSDL